MTGLTPNSTPSSEMSRTRSRLYAIGATLFLLTGIAHTIGQFAPSELGIAERTLVAMMRATGAGGSSMSYWNILMDWGAMYGLMTFCFGLALFAVRLAGADARSLRAFAQVAALAAAGQAIVSLIYRTPPPVFFMVPAAVMFAIVGATKPGPSADSSPPPRP